LKRRLRRARSAIPSDTELNGRQELAEFFHLANTPQSRHPPFPASINPVCAPKSDADPELPSCERPDRQSGARGLVFASPGSPNAMEARARRAANMLANHLELEMPHICDARAPFLESPTICKTRPGLKAGDYFQLRRCPGSRRLWVNIDTTLPFLA